MVCAWWIVACAVRVLGRVVVVCAWWIVACAVRVLRCLGSRGVCLVVGAVLRAGRCVVVCAWWIVACAVSLGTRSLENWCVSCGLYSINGVI